MFAFKKEYFFIITNTDDINLNYIKRYNKFNVIYRNQNIISNLPKVKSFRDKCRLKGINFFVANNIHNAVLLKADGIYISAYNKKLEYLNLIKLGFSLIGGAHNFKEIHQKKNQGCRKVIVSQLFKVSGKPKGKVYGIIKFNNFHFFYKNIIPLGGIKSHNINKLKMLNAKAFTIMSEIKKKPTISSRLF